jgi:hypothetical protein
MRLGRLLTVVVALALAFVSGASAKEGGRAHLLAPLPTHAVPGSTIAVKWSVDIPGAGGRRIPFGANGMFVRLVGRNGHSTQATAPQYQPPYRVRVRVPRGGIRGVRFGLMGTACDASGCRPSPIFFPLARSAPEP